MKSNINIYLEALKKEILPNNKRSDFLIRILEKRLLDPAKENINKHHIFPVSWDGPNNKENFVKLTESEHFKVHQLLYEVTIDKDKKNSMQRAYWRMSHCGEYKIKNHKEYERLRIEYCKTLSEEMKGKPSIMKDKKHSEETKTKISEAKKGKPAWNKGKPAWNKGKPHSEEHKQKLKKPKSEEHKVKLREVHIGKPSPKKGKKYGPNTKISETKAFKYTQEETDFILQQKNLGLSISKITKAFNKKFDKNISEKAIINHIKRNKK